MRAEVFGHEARDSVDAGSLAALSPHNPRVWGLGLRVSGLGVSVEGPQAPGGAKFPPPIRTNQLFHDDFCCLHFNLQPNPELPARQPFLKPTLCMPNLRFNHEC